MPQIASAYIVSAELTSQLKTLTDEDEYDELMAALHAQAISVKPEYPYSGYVLSVVSEYLSEQGVELPINAKWLGEDVFEESEQSWLLCVDARQAVTILERLDSLRFSEDDPRRYFEEFNQETAPESGKMMIEGIAYLQNGLQQVKALGGWLIVMIG